MLPSDCEGGIGDETCLRYQGKRVVHAAVVVVAPAATFLASIGVLVSVRCVHAGLQVCLELLVR